VTLLIVMMLLRLWSSVSMVVIPLGIVKDGSSCVELCDCEDDGDPSCTVKDGSSRDKFDDCDHGCGIIKGGLSCDKLGDCEHDGDSLGTIEGRSSHVK
jgi:hypothetical protein